MGKKMKEVKAWAGISQRLAGLHDKLAQSHPKLTRGMVWCKTCGRSEKVDSAECLRKGWPKCCGYTMTIDAPGERLSMTPVSGDVG